MAPVHILMALGVAVIWGMGFIVAKAAMGHFSPILLMALRFAVTALALCCFFRPPRRLLKPLFWISLVSAALQYSLTFTGVSGIPASTAALLVQLEVPFGLLLAWILLKERITLRQVIGIALAFAGALLILGAPSLTGNIKFALLVVAGAFTWAVGQVMIKKTGELDGFVLISGVALFATPQLFIASWLLEDNQITQVIHAGIDEWGAVLYLGLIMTAVAYAFWYRLLGLYNVNKVMPFLLLLPVTSVIGGVLFLNETLTLLTVAGGALAITGVAIITIHIGGRNVTGNRHASAWH